MDERINKISKSMCSNVFKPTILKTTQIEINFIVPNHGFTNTYTHIPNLSLHHLGFTKFTFTKIVFSLYCTARQHQGQKACTQKHGRPASIYSKVVQRYLFFIKCQLAWWLIPFNYPPHENFRALAYHLRVSQVQ